MLIINTRACIVYNNTTRIDAIHTAIHTATHTAIHTATHTATHTAIHDVTLLYTSYHDTYDIKLHTVIKAQIQLLWNVIAQIIY